VRVWQGHQINDAAITVVADDNALQVIGASCVQIICGSDKEKTIILVETRNALQFILRGY
jgi:hypothetical protein